MLIDSNIIIYAAKPEHPDLRRFIAEYTPALTDKLTLVTRNTKDFDWIEGLSLLNPFDVA